MVLGKAICSSESSSTVSKEFDGNDDKNGSYKNNTNFSVLVVDDDKVARTIHKLMLKAHGMEVKVAANGKAAVDFHVAGASFDLILMDMAMPIMNGFQATKELRDMGIISPIVGVTSSNRVTEMKMFMEAGLDDCVSKPLNIDKIASFLPVFIATTATSTNAATSAAAATSTNNNNDEYNNNNEDYDNYGDVDDCRSSTSSNNN